MTSKHSGMAGELMSSCTKQLISATFILTPDFILEIAIFWIICRRLDEKLELQISNSFSCFILWYQGFFMKESYFYFIYFHKYLLLTSCIFINIRQCQLVNFSHLSFVFCSNAVFQYIFFFFVKEIFFMIWETKLQCQILVLSCIMNIFMHLAPLHFEFC